MNETGNSRAFGGIVVVSLHEARDCQTDVIISVVDVIAQECEQAVDGSRGFFGGFCGTEKLNRLRREMRAVMSSRATSSVLEKRKAESRFIEVFPGS